MKCIRDSLTELFTIKSFFVIEGLYESWAEALPHIKKKSQITQILFQKNISLFLHNKFTTYIKEKS